MLRRLAPTLVFVSLAVAGPSAQQGPPATILASPPFELYLEQLRLQAGIPGLSAAIVQDGQLVWERGLGFQNVETRLRATPDTPYPVADLSQTLAAVLLLDCAERRRLDLDAPISHYGVVLPEPGATVRHVMSHASNGRPGEAFRYEPERYAQLTPIVETCTQEPYHKSVSSRILDRVAMIDSVPGRDLQDGTVVPEGLYGSSVLQRYARTLERMAMPYKSDRKGRMIRADLPPVEGINAATGLISTVRDLARFEEALDPEPDRDPILLRPETLALAWTAGRISEPATLSGGQNALPTGLGWFVQTYRGERVVWHFGLVPNAYSSMVIKVPSRRITLILLANSDGLAAPFQLSAGDVTRSLFAIVFLRLFVV